MTSSKPSPAGKATVHRRDRKGPEAKKGMRLGGYIRVSAVGERDTESQSYMTERSQHDKIESWGKEKSVGIAWGDPPYLDRDVSGKKRARPSLDRLLADVRAGVIDGIAVCYLDRFSRAKPADAMKVVEEMVALRKPLAVLDMPGADPTTSTGELVLNVMLSIARFYSRQRGEKWRDARDDAISSERRLYIAAATPFGYRRVDDHGQPVGPNARAAKLDVDPVEGPIVTELYERRAAGESWNSLLNWLRSTGIRPPANRKRERDPNDSRKMVTVEVPRVNTWAPHHLGKLVPRRIYLGELDDSKYSGVRVEGAHPPLTDPITWQMANDRVGAAPKKVQGPDLLGGMVRCAGCRYKMSRYHSRSEGWFRYRCTRDRDQGDCPEPGSIILSMSNGHRKLSEDQRAEVARRLEAGETKAALGREFGISAPAIPWAVRPAMQGLEQYVVEQMWKMLERCEMEIAVYGDSEELGNLKAEAERAEAERDADAEDLELRGLLGDTAWRKRMAARRRVADEKRAVYEEKARTVRQPLIDRPVSELREEWESGRMPLEAKRSLLTQLIQWVFVGRGGRGADGRVRIVWAAEPPVDVPRQGRGQQWVPTPFPLNGSH